MDEPKDVILSKACLDAHFEVNECKRDDGTDTGRLTGYAATFDNVDAQGDTFRKGAFAKTIKERVAAGKVAIMVRHYAHGGDVEECVGVLDHAEENKRGLKVSGAFFGDERSQAVRQKIKSAPSLFQQSVGFRAIRANPLHDKSGKETGREFLEAALHEVTLTLVPANSRTTASAKTVNEIEELRQRVEALEKRTAAPSEGGSTVLPARPTRTSALLKRRIALLKRR